MEAVPTVGQGVASWPPVLAYEKLFWVPTATYLMTGTTPASRAQWQQVQPERGPLHRPKAILSSHSSNQFV